MSMIMGETVELIDRISELPDFIIHHIMSSLSVKEVTQTSILSKRWNCLQKSFPILDFDETYFMGEDLNNNERFRERINEFIKFIDVSMLRFCQLKLCIQKFRLFISIVDVKKSSSFFDKWIQLAIEKEVKELELDFDFITDSDPVYALPQTIFSANLATTLKIAGCKLEQPFDTIRFHSLKKLTLDRVGIREDMVQKLTNDCPLLEELYFSSCWRLKHLRVSKAHNLKIMEVSLSSTCKLETVEISLSSLQELTLRFTRVHRPQVSDLKGCKHLKKLTLVCVNFTDQEFDHFISKIPLLEYLFVSYCHLLERITISGIPIKDLRFSSCSKLKAVDVDTPNLVSFVYEYTPILSASSSIRAQCEWKLNFIPAVEKSIRRLINLSRLTERYTEIEDLTINVKGNMNTFDSIEFETRSRALLPSRARNLNLYIEPPSDYKVSDYLILLDALLWICLPRTLSLRTLKSQHEFFKMFHDRMKNMNVCYNNYSRKWCWRRHLKDVKIENFLRHGDQKLFTRDELMKLLNIDNLTDAWDIFPEGRVRFQLKWCFPALSNYL